MQVRLIPFLVLIAPFILLLSLSGCAGRAAGYAQTLEDEVRAVNDVKAGLYSSAPCAMSLGAWARLENKTERDANFIRCVPDHESYGLKIIKE